MRKYGYLVVEGPHDVEFCYRLLRTYGLKRVQHLDSLDQKLKDLVPTKYPPDGDLQKRVPVPLFLQSDRHAVAIHSAIGDTRLVATLQETLLLLDANTFGGVGVMLDSDSGIAAAARHEWLRQQVAQAGIGVLLPNNPGVVTVGTPRVGTFIFPDNQNQGTLEDLLLAGAGVNYATLLPVARQYVEDAIQGGMIPADHREDINKPAGKNKAVVGALASLFKPGKAVQTSIQDNSWLRGAALQIPSIQVVQHFLAELFELLPTAPDVQAVA